MFPALQSLIGVTNCHQETAMVVTGLKINVVMSVSLVDISSVLCALDRKSGFFFYWFCFHMLAV